MNAVAAIQARTSSSRLPGKVLADVEGRPLVLRVVERALQARHVERVVVLTSTDPSDDALAGFLEREGVEVRRGPLDDVLARYTALVEELEPRFVVRITGDCPFVAPEFVDAQIEALTAFDGDFAHVAPDGIEGTLAGQAVLSARALLLALESDDPADREHVGSFFFKRHAERFRHVRLDVDPAYRRPGLRLCVDEARDLALARAVHRALAPAGRPAPPLLTILRWLDAHPEIRALNAAVEESGANQRARGLARDARVTTVGRWP